MHLPIQVIFALINNENQILKLLGNISAISVEKSSKWKLPWRKKFTFTSVVKKSRTYKMWDLSFLNTTITLASAIVFFPSYMYCPPMSHGIAWNVSQYRTTLPHPVLGPLEDPFLFNWLDWCLTILCAAIFTIGLGWSMRRSDAKHKWNRNLIASFN